MFIHALGKSAGLEVISEALVALRAFSDGHYTYLLYPCTLWSQCEQYYSSVFFYNMVTFCQLSCLVCQLEVVADSLK